MPTVVKIEKSRKSKAARTRRLRQEKGRKRYIFHQSTGEDIYGENAQQPDMSKKKF